jgi:hypothetical protein
LGEPSSKAASLSSSSSSGAHVDPSDSISTQPQLAHLQPLESQSHQSPSSSQSAHHLLPPPPPTVLASLALGRHTARKALRCAAPHIRAALRPLLRARSRSELYRKVVNLLRSPPLAVAASGHDDGDDDEDDDNDDDNDVCEDKDKDGNDGGASGAHDGDSAVASQSPRQPRPCHARSLGSHSSSSSSLPLCARHRGERLRRAAIAFHTRRVATAHQHQRQQQSLAATASVSSSSSSSSSSVPSAASSSSSASFASHSAAAAVHVDSSLTLWPPFDARSAGTTSTSGTTSGSSSGSTSTSGSGSVASGLIMSHVWMDVGCGAGVEACIEALAESTGIALSL